MSSPSQASRVWLLWPLVSLPWARPSLPSLLQVSFLFSSPGPVLLPPSSRRPVSVLARLVSAPPPSSPLRPADPSEASGSSNTQDNTGSLLIRIHFDHTSGR